MSKGGREPIEKYIVCYADPPWRYSAKRVQGAAEHHYPTMSIEDLCALPVADLMAPDSALFLWATFPQLPDALRLIEAWGFQYKTVAFVWLKQNRRSPGWFYGLGFWTRGNAEVCLLATRGHPKRQPISTNSSFLPLRNTAKSRTRRGRKFWLLWGTFPVWSCSPASPRPAGTCGETRWSPPWNFGNSGSPQSRQTLWGEEAQRNRASFGTKCPEARVVEFVPTSPKGAEVMVKWPM